jgi:hypothetical protein
MISDMYNVSYELTHTDKTTTIHDGAVGVPGLQALIHHYVLSFLEKFHASEGEVKITELEQGASFDLDTFKFPPGSKVTFSSVATVIELPSAAAD